MKFIVDTSAALSLSCSLHFRTILNEHTLLITNGVEQELKQFAEYSDELGLKAKEFLQLKLPKEMPKFFLSLKLEKAEIEVFSFCCTAIG